MSLAPCRASNASSPKRSPRRRGAPPTPPRAGPARAPPSSRSSNGERARIEDEFYLAVAAEERLLPLFDPLNSHGRLWDQEQVDDVLASVVECLVKLSMTLGLRITDHLYRYRAMWCAHRVLWDAVDVQLAPGTTWTRGRVIDAVLDRIAAARALDPPTDWHAARAAQLRARALDAELAAACPNVGEVEREARSLLDCPRRSSSLVEAFNNVLRVVQQAHRHVSDDLLALHALKWNLSPRRGPSPYARLGVDFADDTRSWMEVLLEEMDRG
jgi:hypothetical protein